MILILKTLYQMKTQIKIFFICYVGYKIRYNVKTLHIWAAARVKILGGGNNLIFNKIESQLQKYHNF